MKTMVNLNEKANEQELTFPALYLFCCKSGENIWLITSNTCGVCIVPGRSGYAVGYLEKNLDIIADSHKWRRLDPNESVTLQND